MEESPPQLTPEATAKRLVLRVGWSTVGIGVGAAVVAAAIGGYNANSTMAGATALQRVGALIMLLGLIVVLAAYRVAWLRTRWRRRMSTEPADFSRAFLRLMQFCYIGVPVTIGAIALPWILLVVIPDVAAGILILCASLLLPIVLTTILVYGRGYWRTFCIGAMFPAGVFFAGMGITYPWMVGRWSRMYSVWHFFEEFGEAAHFAGFIWTFTVLSGLLAMGTRFLITVPMSRSNAAQPRDHAEPPIGGQQQVDGG